MNVRDLVPWSRSADRDHSLPTWQDRASSVFTLRREMNHLFDDVFRGFPMARAWPHIEVEDSETEYRVTAELPDLEARDVEILVQDDVLILRGEKRAKTEDRNRAFSERIYGRFERRMALDGASEADIRAEFRDGGLTISIPKAVQSGQRMKRIPVNPVTH